MVKNPPDSAGDTGEVGSIPGLGKSPGGQYGNPLQYFSWENPMDRGAWPATVHGVAKGLGHDQETNSYLIRCNHDDSTNAFVQCFLLCTHISIYITLFH